MREPELTLSTMLFILFSVGICLVLMIGRETNWFRTWRKNSKEIEKIRDEFAGLMSERLGVAMRAAELDKLVIDKWEAWPLEYRPTLYQILRHTQLLEETMYEEAASKGIYPRRIVTQGGPYIPPPPALPSLPSEPKQEQTRPSNVVRIPAQPSHEWVHGQLVKTG